jgi:hypothetical protein
MDKTKAQSVEGKRPLGRPPKPSEEKQSERVMVYLTPGERRWLEEMAAKEEMGLATLIMRPWREQKGKQ